MPGRKKLIDPPVRWRLNLPQSLATLIDLMLYDPVMGEVGYGQRSQYITRLIKEDLAKRRAIQAEVEIQS